MARFDTDMKGVVPRLGTSGLVSGANAESTLGVEFTTPTDAVIASGRFLTAD